LRILIVNLAGNNKKQESFFHPSIHERGNDVKKGLLHGEALEKRNSQTETNESFYLAKDKFIHHWWCRRNDFMPSCLREKGLPNCAFIKYVH
jgi:hypothetical protein